MQKEAEQGGWLSVYNEFSWWYPWYRLHFVAVVANESVLDVGLSPLGCDILSISSQFGSWLDDAIRDLIIYPIVKAYLIGWIASEITLFAAMYYGLPGFLAGLGLSLVIKEALFMSASDSGLKGAFVGALFSLAYGFLSALKKVVDIGITTLSAFLEVSKLNLWKLLFKFIYVPINMIYLIRIIFRLVAVGVW